MKYYKKIITSILIFLICGNIFAQESKENLIQFSGVVVSADSIRAIPYTSIIILNMGRGTICDYYGYFSFVAKKQDTVVFSSIGYKKDIFIIPDTITSNRYSLIQVMSSDTIMLTETVIYPWPTKEQFKEAFLELDIPDDDLAIAQKNLDKDKLRQKGENMRMSASMNYRHFMDKHHSKLYYAGQTQPITILNPFAWAKFIKAWRDGKFKKKDKD